MSSTRSDSDVLVIGGGVVGCAVAWRSAQAGLRVTLAERDECGRACSWAGAGILDPGSAARTDPLAELRRRSLARYADFVAELVEATGVDPQFARCGLLDLIVDDNQDAAADREVAAASGRTTADGRPAVERVDPDNLLRLEPALARDLRGALLVRDAAQVRSPRLLRALRLACIHAGVQLLEQTPVTSLLVHGSRVDGALTPTRELSAQFVVLAAGAWSTQIDRRLSGLVDVHPVRGQIALLEPPRRPLDRVVMCGRKYVLCRADGRTLAGTTDEPEAGFAAHTTPAGIERILDFAGRAVPALRTARLARTWAGLRPGTRDGRPYLGRVPGFDGLIAATGHYRSGLMLAPVTADLVARLITSGSSGADLSEFAPGR